MRTMRTRKKQSPLYVFPLAILLCIFPLLLHLYEFDNGLGEYAWMGQSDSSMDLFLHCKMVFFEGLCIACILLLLAYIWQTEQRIRLPRTFILLLGYAVLAFVSTMASPYRVFGFSGIYEQFENIWSILGYLLIITYSYIVLNDFKKIQPLIYALLFGTLLIGIIGTLQFLGHDPLMSSLAQSLYIPTSLKGTQVNLAFAVGTVYMTLYNPDYVGLYTALVCPVLLAIVYFYKEKWVRILAGISCAMLVLGTIGAQATGGYIGLAVSCVALMVFMLRKMTQTRKYLMIAITSILATVVVSFFGYWLHMCIASSVTETQQTDASASNVVVSETPAVLPSECRLDSIHETDDYVEFCYNDITFRESMEVRDGIVYLNLTDTDGNDIAYDYDESSMVYTLTEPGLEGITSYSVSLMHTYIGFSTMIDGKEWTFTYTSKDDDGYLSYYMMNSLERLDKNISSESAVFTDHYAMFSGRGYIWAKTIPLLKKYVLLGSGADTFALIFPQSDYVSAYKGGYENMIVSKPHNAYLQVAVQTGLLSLVLLLAFYLWYAWKCIRLYFMRRIDSVEQALAVAIFSGITGFMVILLANDSTICITPVFAALLSIGIVLNRINETAYSQENSTATKKEKRRS